MIRKIVMFLKNFAGFFKEKLLFPYTLLFLSLYLSTSIFTNFIHLNCLQVTSAQPLLCFITSPFNDIENLQYSSFLMGLYENYAYVAFVILVYEVYTNGLMKKFTVFISAKIVFVLSVLATYLSSFFDWAIYLGYPPTGTSIIGFVFTALLAIVFLLDFGIYFVQYSMNRTSMSALRAILTGLPAALLICFMSTYFTNSEHLIGAFFFLFMALPYFMNVKRTPNNFKSTPGKNDTAKRSDAKKEGFEIKESVDEQNAQKPS